MLDPDILYILILAFSLVGIWALWRMVRSWLDQVSAPDVELEHVQPNDDPEMSDETQSKLLAVGMAEQHKRR